ncbi:MAG TPA: sigma-70 family RNA polymerase sigma factor [Thermomicrobiales bacterium]
MSERAPREPRPWQVRAEEDRWLGQLAGAARAGERAARDALWAAVGPRLVHMARRTAWAFPSLEPDDAVQECFPIFTTLVATWPGPAADGAGFATYLFGMFRWRLHTILRAYERRHASDVDWHAREERTIVAPSRVYAPVAWDEYGVDFPAFVASLPAPERAIFLLRLREGLATREVASRLGIAPRTVSRHWNATLRRLRAVARRGEQGL